MAFKTLLNLKTKINKDLDLEEEEFVQPAELNEYINDAIQGNIPVERMTFDANKVFKKEGNTVKDITGSFGEVMYKLADVNCCLWHEQEKVYEFEKVPVEEKDKVVKKLALLNLERNKCIDRINSLFAGLILKKIN